MPVTIWRLSLADAIAGKEPTLVRDDRVTKFAAIAPAPVPAIARGRPRVHASNAERQAAYRARKRAP
jgi:hypothetical protein